MYKMLPILGMAILLGMNLCIGYANRLYGFGNGWSNLGLAIVCTVVALVIGPISAAIAYKQKRISVFVCIIFLAVAYPINQNYYYCVHMKMSPGALDIAMMAPFYLIIVALITAVASKTKMA